MITSMNEPSLLTPDCPAYQANQDCFGVIKIWQFDRTTGESWLVKDTRNTILYTGADLLALALSGRANSSISHVYVGYSNNSGFDIEAEPAVTKGSTAFRDEGGYGYVRVPLTFPASFAAESNYSNNSVFFTIMLANAPSSSGAELNATSKIFTIGLVAGLNPSGANQDKIFSRAQFTPVTYDPTFGLTVTWGVKFIAN